MNKKTDVRFIIYSPPYNENNGGAIVLHRLCHLINSLGFKAYFFSNKTPIYNENKPISSAIRLVAYTIKAKFKPRTNPHFLTPVANTINSKTDIVIYPEIVDGNPLKAKNIVRWFLHKPGHLTGNINYGEGELYFYFQESFNDVSLNPDWDNKLRVLYLFDDIYKQTNFEPRKGSCYMLRKGAHKKLVHDASKSTLIDGLSHKKIAQIFNQVETFISYDSRTLFVHYAVMCGCKSIIIPDDGVDIEKWQPEKELRSGVAYGFDDTKRAEETRDLQIEMLKKEEYESINDTNKFVGKCISFFR